MSNRTFTLTPFLWLQACLLANVWGISVVYLQVVVDALIGQTSEHPHHSHHSLAAYASDALSAASQALAGSALPAQGDGGLADSGLSASMGLPDPARALLQGFDPSSAGELPGLGLQVPLLCSFLAPCFSGSASDALNNPARAQAPSRVLVRLPDEQSAEALLNVLLAQCAGMLVPAGETVWP